MGYAVVAEDTKPRQVKTRQAPASGNKENRSLYQRCGLSPMLKVECFLEV